MTPELTQWFKRNGIKSPILTLIDLKALPLATRNKLLFKIAGNIQVLDALLTAGVEVNQQDLYGASPLHHAVLAGNTKCLFKLMGADVSGITINALNLNQDTPLLWAADRSKPEILLVLLAGGADVNHQNAMGMAPLHVAAAKGYTTNIKYLVEQKLRGKQGADLNLQDKGGWTALHHAVQNGHFEAVKYLVEAGANIMLTTQADLLFPKIKPETPRQFAAQLEDATIHRYLLKKEIELLSAAAQKMATTKPENKVTKPVPPVGFNKQPPERHMAATFGSSVTSAPNLL